MLHQSCESSPTAARTPQVHVHAAFFGSKSVWLSPAPSEGISGDTEITTDSDRSEVVRLVVSMLLDAAHVRPLSGALEGNSLMTPP